MHKGSSQETSCACQEICLKKILGKLQFIQEKTIVIYYDNNFAIKLSQNPILNGLSKHRDIRYHYLRELTNEKVIDLIYCRSEDQLADIFTKALRLPTFEKFRRLHRVCTV